MLGGRDLTRAPLTPGWEAVPYLFDRRVFLARDLNACMESLKLRNTVIPGYTPEEIARRVDLSDRANGELVLAAAPLAADKTYTVTARD